MNFSAWAIKNPVPVILIFILLTLLGLISFMKLPVQNFPDMDLPFIMVSASLEGAAPAQLETEIARKMEDSLASLSRLDHIQTLISDSSVNISVIFEIEKDPDSALSEVRNAIDSIRNDLPPDMTPPTIFKGDVQGDTLLTYVVTSVLLDEAELSWFVDDQVTTAVLSAGGVGEVKRIGGVDREIQVELNSDIMSALGLTAADISNHLKAVGEDQSGGRGEFGAFRMGARTLGAAASVEELSAMIIPVAGGEYARLEEVATIKDAWADRSSMAFYDGASAVAVQIKRSNGYSDLEVAARVRAALAALESARPEVKLIEAANMVDPVVDDYQSSMRMLCEGALIAVIVVWLFLRDWRATALAAVALPLSLIPTFLVMSLCGFTLNSITLLALSLVVGILVDDAIVEIENISRHSGLGLAPWQVALEAANEIGLAVIATTFTLVAIFLPTAFMGGVPGIVFRQFGITASVAVLASLLVARLLTPMMAAAWMKPENGSKSEGAILKGYLSLARFCLENPGKTMAVTILIFALSLAVIPFIGTSFRPPADISQSKVTLTLAPGTDIEETRQAALEAAGLIGGIDGVRSVFTAVGAANDGGKGAPSGGGDSASAVLTVNLWPLSERDRTQAEIEAEIRNSLSQVAGARVEVGDGEGVKLDITLAGDDADLLNKTAYNLEKDLRGVAELGAVSSGAARQAPEIQIYPKFDQAAALGVTTKAMAEVVRVATNGAYSAELPKLNLPERQVPIKVRFNPMIRGDLENLTELRVQGRNGPVPLGSVAELRIGGGPAQINRIDRQKNITISVELNGISLGQAANIALNLPSIKNLPQGISLINQGETQMMNDLLGSLGAAMFIGVFCVYAVLVLLFKDFKQPVTILAAMPLALGGGSLGSPNNHRPQLFVGSGHRYFNADGHCHQKFDSLGGICHHLERTGFESPGGPYGSLPQARPPHCHDFIGHGRGNDASYPGPFRRRCQLQASHGHCSGGRLNQFHLSESGHHSGYLYTCG